MSATLASILDIRGFSRSVSWSCVTLDMHTAGEPLRVLVHPESVPPGNSLLERRRNAAKSWDLHRTFLMHEPRGHRDMYGAVILPPDNAAAAFGVLFLHKDGYSTMCGHGVIALARLAVELEWVPAMAPISTFGIDTPAGLVTAHAEVDKGRVLESGFRNVPSFVVCRNSPHTIPSLGEMKVDVAFGGAFYAFVDADALNLSLEPTSLNELVKAATLIKRELSRSLQLSHPTDDDLAFLYGIIFHSSICQKEVHSRHICVFADGVVDRSPTGTGVAARMALLHEAGEVGIGNNLQFESVTGETLRGSVVATTADLGIQSVIVDVSGRAYLTGVHHFMSERDDPLRLGFIL